MTRFFWANRFLSESSSDMRMPEHITWQNYSPSSILFDFHSRWIWIITIMDELIEDITWPRGDTKLLFECWKIFHEWVQRMGEIFFQHEKGNVVSPSGHVMFYFLYKYQWNSKLFHFNTLFGVKGAIYYVAIATVIFSHVKIISSFRAKAHLVFHCSLHH